jgi:hypothetical protein
VVARQAKWIAVVSLLDRTPGCSLDNIDNHYWGDECVESGLQVYLAELALKS